MLEILPASSQRMFIKSWRLETHARTLENSDEGDITKLSLVFDHDIRCRIL